MKSLKNKGLVTMSCLLPQPVSAYAGGIAYIAPCIEFFPVAVERGFSASEGDNEEGGGMVLPEWGVI